MNATFCLNFNPSRRNYILITASKNQTYTIMKKLGLIFLLLFGAFQLSAQEQSPVFFGQCMIEVTSAEEMAQLQTSMKENPYIKVVRLDYNTQRAFVITQNLESLSEADFTSWFSEYADKIRCIQVGRHGVDAVKPFPFEGCEK